MAIFCFNSIGELEYILLLEYLLNRPAVSWTENPQSIGGSIKANSFVLKKNQSLLSNKILNNLLAKILPESSRLFPLSKLLILLKLTPDL